MIEEPPGYLNRDIERDVAAAPNNARFLVHREAPTHGYLLTFSVWASARRTEAELTCRVLAIVSHVAGGV